MPPQSSEPQPSAARNIYSFGITSFFNDMATEMAYWVLPAFLISLGAGPAQLGVIEGIAESVASFAKLFSGYLTDRLERRKPLVVGGYFVANAVKPLLAITTAWWHILLIRFSDRLAKGVRGAPRDVMVAESVGKERLGAAYGLIQSLDSAGAIAGPLMALVLLARFGIRSVFWAAAVPGAIAVLVALFGIREAETSFKKLRIQDCHDGRHGQVRIRNFFAGGVLRGTDRSDTVFAGEFERHVSGDAGAERWNPSVAGTATRTGFQCDLHARIVASRMVQRSFFASLDRRRGISDFFRGLFRLREGAVDARDLDHDGDLWLVLRAHATSVESAGG